MKRSDTIREILVPALFFALLFGCFAPLPPATGQDASRPNVVILLADDLGYADLGCYAELHNAPHHARTPTLDALAEQGMKFTSFYAGAPVCSPSRAD